MNIEEYLPINKVYTTILFEQNLLYFKKILLSLHPIFMSQYKVSLN